MPAFLDFFQTESRSNGRIKSGNFPWTQYKINSKLPTNFMLKLIYYDSCFDFFKLNPKENYRIKSGIFQGRE